jgi:hypothetical protein
MNKEQIKFKKVIKRRIKRVGKIKHEKEMVVTRKNKAMGKKKIKKITKK